jgi:hypothetical protein
MTTATPFGFTDAQIAYIWATACSVPVLQQRELLARIAMNLAAMSGQDPKTVALALAARLRPLAAAETQRPRPTLAQLGIKSALPPLSVNAVDPRMLILFPASDQTKKGDPS